jgi:drug/metabolite transporter (DMT)-like permease
MCGVIILIGPEALRGLGHHGLGQLAILGAALSYACGGIYGRRFKTLSPVVTAAGQLAGTMNTGAPPGTGLGTAVDLPTFPGCVGRYAWTGAAQHGGRRALSTC